MRARLLCAIAVASFLSTAAAQESSAPSSTGPTQKNDSKPVTLTGCVTADSLKDRRFSLVDFTNGTITYRLSGTDVRRYLGKRVELVGSTIDPKVKIVGGLTPSPNIAAQAGAIDPTRAAMAAQGAEGNARPGNIEVPELRVKTVRAVPGNCSR